MSRNVLPPSFLLKRLYPWAPYDQAKTVSQNFFYFREYIWLQSLKFRTRNFSLRIKTGPATLETYALMEWYSLSVFWARYTVRSLKPDLYHCICSAAPVSFFVPRFRLYLGQCSREPTRLSTSFKWTCRTFCRKCSFWALTCLKLLKRWWVDWPINSIFLGIQYLHSSWSSCRGGQ